MLAKIPHVNRHFAIYPGNLCFSKAHLGWESIDVASIILLLFFQVAVQTADSAKSCLSQSFKIEANIEMIKESETKANGTGSGIM